MNSPDTPTVEQICARLGRARLARALGVGLTAISNATVEGRFPAKWFLVVTTLCETDGIECPPSLFKFVSATSEDAA